MKAPKNTSHDPIRPLLRRIGLDDKEAEIYLATLSLKIARASTIATAAKQPRSNTYLLLRQLAEKGLVSEVERGKIIHFIAEPPERLKQYVQDKEAELRSLEPLIDGILPVLSSLTKPLTGVPRVTTLKGTDGMRRLYRDALSKEIRGVFNPQSMFDTFGENIVTKLFGKNVQLRGRDLLTYGPAAKKYLQEVKPHDDYAVKILPKDAQFETDSICFEDTIAYFAYDEEMTIVRIESKNMADAFRAWFDIMWKASM